ncbi:MAG: hypothetical protein AVDCRST_MAG77-3261 [uncultured Chloroflexi bacterium]|uniref:Glycosyltransferase n=1 Tax=uncultured Chloroflexota bacterium TaxID=166587 RepID=A0A6J4J7K7_9CHLR|nr:MAG: hypothetical protein AVDCRST_MAG77-3261 [uncultured Chloroflexota bacterium]
MRLLLVTDTLAPTYGWGTYSIGLIRALARRGLDFRLLSPRGLCEAEDLARLPDHGVVTSFVSETRRLPRLALANAPRIWRALRDCDAVHCLTEPYAIPAAIAVGRKPLLVTLHGTYAVRPFSRPRERPWYELAYRRANRLFPVSHFTERLLPARFRGPRTLVVPHGVEVERFAARAAGEPVTSPPERPFLLSVGPIKRRKGYHHTLEAFARVRAARPDVEYWIAGGTDDRVFLGQIQEQITTLGLQGAVRLLGRISEEEKVRLYQQCALFWLLPVSDDQQFEAFGLVYWEANAAGKPIIGALRTGAEGAIDHGDNGFLVDAADPEAAARAALDLLNDPARASIMGEAGRRKVRPWDDAAAMMMDQYRAVLGGPRPATPLAPAEAG